MREAFEAWWQTSCKCSNAGGYEKTFAWEAWQAAMKHSTPKAEPLSDEEISEFHIRAMTEAPRGKYKEYFARLIEAHLRGEKK